MSHVLFSKPLESTWECWLLALCSTSCCNGLSPTNFTGFLHLISIDINIIRERCLASTSLRHCAAHCSSCIVLKAGSLLHTLFYIYICCISHVSSIISLISKTASKWSQPGLFYLLNSSLHCSELEPVSWHNPTSLRWRCVTPWRPRACQVLAKYQVIRRGGQGHRKLHAGATGRGGTVLDSWPGMVGAPCTGICPDGVDDACTEFIATKHSKRRTMSPWHHHGITMVFQTSCFACIALPGLWLWRCDRLRCLPEQLPQRHTWSEKVRWDFKIPTAESKGSRGAVFSPNFLCLIGSGAGAGLELSGGSHWNWKTPWEELWGAVISTIRNVSSIDFAAFTLLTPFESVWYQGWDQNWLEKGINGCRESLGSIWSQWGQGMWQWPGSRTSCRSFHEWIGPRVQTVLALSKKWPSK